MSQPEHPMSLEDMCRFAELAQDFYTAKQEESGMVEPIRKAWATNKEGGLLIVVSCFGVHSRELAKKLNIPWETEDVRDQEGI